MKTDVSAKREIKVAMPRIEPFVASRGRRPMVIVVGGADPRPVHGVVFAEDDRALEYQTPVVQTRG